MNDVSLYEPPPSDRGHMLFDPSAFRNAMEVAGVLAQSQLIPQHFRGKPADVLLGMNLARRMGEDPLTILQVVHFVGGKPGWSAPFIISRINQSGLLAEPLEFEVEGEGKTLSVTCRGTLKRGGVRTSVVDMQMAIDEGWTRNPKYKSMPVVMLRYRAATFWCRLYCPEVLFGMPVADELTDIDDTVPVVPVREGVMPRGTAAIDRVLGVGFPTHTPDDGPVVPETPAPPVKAEPVKVEAPKANAVSDAALLRNALTSLPVTLEFARKQFREAAGMSKVGEERWRALLGVGVLKGWWSVTDTDLCGPIGAAPDALPPEPEPKADTGDDGLAPGELQLKVAVAEERADEARVLAAAQAAGLPIVDGLPVTDGAPDSMLRRYLAELTKEGA